MQTPGTAIWNAAILTATGVQEKRPNLRTGAGHICSNDERLFFM
jgi:hypothetical protein